LAVGEQFSCKLPLIMLGLCPISSSVVVIPVQ
jgi:hypothetical protein